MTLDIVWVLDLVAGAQGGCGGVELVEITSQLHRALPRPAWHTRLQWEVPADYSGWLDHPSITRNFHTQPSINIPSPLDEITELTTNDQYQPVLVTLSNAHNVKCRKNCGNIFTLCFSARM